MIWGNTIRAIISIPVLALFLALSTHGQIEHSCFAELPFPSTARSAFHLHGVSTSDVESGHVHEAGDLDSSTDSHSHEGSDESDHDADSHIHPREFTPTKAPLNLQIPSFVPNSSLIVFTMIKEKEDQWVSTARCVCGPAPPLYLQCSALLSCFPSPERWSRS